LRIALKGTTGFFGRRVASAAVAAGHRVRGLVAPGGAPPPEGVEAVEGRLGDASAARLVEGADVVLQLAAFGVKRRERTWSAMALDNVVHPLALLDAAAAAGVGRVVLAGSCLEYSGHGRLPDAPASEARPCHESSPTEPPEPYGATKAAGGLLQRTRARELRLPAWYLRFASLYGPGDYGEKFLPAAVHAALTGTAFEMTRGEQVREWLHVDDAVAALLAAAATPPPEPVTTVNVGSGEGLTLRELVRAVFEIAGADPELVRAGARPYRGEVHRLVMDVSRARSALGSWRPRVELHAGLAALVREEARRMSRG
jgi:nucleoside-diphosphate-sugar epimerase